MDLDSLYVRITSFPSTTCWSSCVPFTVCSWPIPKDQMADSAWGSVPLIPVSVFVPVPWCLITTALLYCLYSGIVVPSTVLLLHRITFGGLALFCFHDALCLVLWGNLLVFSLKLCSICLSVWGSLFFFFISQDSNSGSCTGQAGAYSAQLNSLPKFGPFDCIKFAYSRSRRIPFLVSYLLSFFRVPWFSL